MGLKIMSFISFAESELDRIGMTADSDDEMNVAMREHILRMIPTIFIDMDGVLADLHTGIVELSGNPNIADNRSAFFKKWLPKYVEANGFEDQAPMPNASVLVDFLVKYHKLGKVKLAILTSHGEFYEPFSEVIRQKKAWLEKNFPQLNKIPFLSLEIS
jgi:hypothetical protein